MDMMSTGRFALRLRAPAWRVKRLATLLFTLLLLSYHWGLPTYSATSLLPTPHRNADAQATNALTPQLFYPAVYYGYNDNGRIWNSTLTVQNHATSSATVELVFYNESGQAFTPSSLPTTGNNTIQNPVTLPAGGAATVRIDAQFLNFGLSPNSRYAVVVKSDQPLVGVNWVRATASGNESHGAYQAVSVGSKGPIYLPAVAYAVNSFTSNIAIQNLSNSTLNGVTLNFYDQNGNQAGQPNTAVPPIPAYATAFVHLGGFSMPGVFSGAVVVNSPNGPVAVVDNKIGGASGFTLFSDNGITSAGNTRYAPFLTTESGASATVTIQNTSNNQAATVMVTNSDNVGNTQLNLPPRGSQTVSYSAGSHSRPFAATISANQPVVATAAVQNTGGRGYAYHATAQGATTYRLPLMVTGYQNSGSNAVFSTIVTLFNPGQTQAQVQLFLSNGSPQQVSLQPGEVLHMNNLNSGLVGRATLVSSQPLFAGVLVNGQPAIGQQATGDLQAFYPGVLPPPPPATLTKTANTPHLKPGDPLTYTLSFAAGTDGGAALLVDRLPSQLQNYSYQAGAGVVVTPTGNVDYAWQVAVPAAGGVITVSGIVDPALMTDTLILNTATITTTTSSVSRSVNVTVDVAPPDTTIVSKPTDPSKESTPTFQFSINDGAGSGLAGFECQIDNGNWSSCNTSFTTSTLSDGPHTIAVRAIDQVGYVDASPATYNWTIDTAAPATPTLLTPANGSTINNSQFVTFTWSAVAAADLAGYKLAYNEHLITLGPVTNYTVGPLANGAYTWTVAAYDTLSNTSTFAGAASFTMNVAAPQPLALAPLANSHAATVTTPVSITFDQPIATATVNTRTFAIHAMQSGQRLQSYSINGATITFTPDQPFKPGELVQVSAASGLKGVNGFALLPPKVWQFRAATNGGSGQFVTGSSFGSQHAYDGRLGDMDGDGDLDFLVINYGSGRNNLYLNDGDGTFDTTLYDMGPSSNYQQAVALGDVNGDGRVDVALSTDNNTDTIYLNDGTAHPFDTTTLTLSANSARTDDLAFGDIDGDGDQDLIRCETGALSFYRNNGNNNGNGSFTTVLYSKPFLNCYRVAVGDVNGDGRLDLVFGVAAGIFIYLNDGSGNPFSGPIYQVNGTVYQLTYDLLLGDLDGDGDLDLAINNQSPNRSNKIYFNDGNGNPYDSTTITVGPASGTRTDAMALGDVDGDGDLDVITGNWATNGGGAQDLIYLNDGSGAFPATSNLGPGGFSNMTGGLDVGDLDGDGDLDVAAAMTNNFPQLSYLNNNAPLPVTPTATPSATPTPTLDPSLPTPTPTNTVDPSLPTPTPTNTVDPSLPTPTRTPTTNAPTLTPTATPIPGSPTPTPTLPVADATTVAQPNQPANLTYSDPSGGGVAVQIPAGAIDQPTTFLYDDQGTPSQPGAFQFAGRTFTLTAYRNNSPLENFTFQQPVTLVIDYTDGDVAGIDESSLTLFFYDETNGVWSDQGIIVVARDLVNNRLTVQIPHLTEFAMGVSKRFYLPVVTR